MDARRHNTKNDVTGALVCRQDVFIQLLEGPPEKVEETYARISKDDRSAWDTLLSTIDFSKSKGRG